MIHSATIWIGNSTATKFTFRSKTSKVSKDCRMVQWGRHTMNNELNNLMRCVLCGSSCVIHNRTNIFTCYICHFIHSESAIAYTDYHRMKKKNRYNGINSMLLVTVCIEYCWINMGIFPIIILVCQSWVTICTTVIHALLGFIYLISSLTMFPSSSWKAHKEFWICFSCSIISVGSARNKGQCILHVIWACMKNNAYSGKLIFLWCKNNGN